MGTSSWLAFKLWWFFSLSLPSWGVTEVCCYTHLAFPCVLGIELRSVLTGKCLSSFMSAMILMRYYTSQIWKGRWNYTQFGSTSLHYPPPNTHTHCFRCPWSGKQEPNLPPVLTLWFIHSLACAPSTDSRLLACRPSTDRQTAGSPVVRHLCVHMYTATTCQPRNTTATVECELPFLTKATIVRKPWSY